MTRPAPQADELSFAPPWPLFPSARAHSSVPLTSRRGPLPRATPRSAVPHACVSLDKEAALKAAKNVYKAAKAEYKARKAEYKALKTQLEGEQAPDVEQKRKPKPRIVPNANAVNAVAVCDGKACCRMGADAVAVLLGKQTLRAPCMKMCGGVGPSVRVGGAIVKVDLKKAVRDVLQPDTAPTEPSPCIPAPRNQSDSVLELLRDPIVCNSN